MWKTWKVEVHSAKCDRCGRILSNTDTNAMAREMFVHDVECASA